MIVTVSNHRHGCIVIKSVNVHIHAQSKVCIFKDCLCLFKNTAAVCRAVASLDPSGRNSKYIASLGIFFHRCTISGSNDPLLLQRLSEEFNYIYLCGSDSARICFGRCRDGKLLCRLIRSNCKNTLRRHRGTAAAVPFHLPCNGCVSFLFCFCCKGLCTSFSHNGDTRSYCDILHRRIVRRRGYSRHALQRGRHSHVAVFVKEYLINTGFPVLPKTIP